GFDAGRHFGGAGWGGFEGDGGPRYDRVVDGGDGRGVVCGGEPDHGGNVANRFPSPNPFPSPFPYSASSPHPTPSPSAARTQAAGPWCAETAGTLMGMWTFVGTGVFVGRGTTSVRYGLSTLGRAFVLRAQCGDSAAGALRGPRRPLHKRRPQAGAPQKSRHRLQGMC